MLIEIYYKYLSIKIDTSILYKDSQKKYLTVMKTIKTQ